MTGSRISVLIYILLAFTVIGCKKELLVEYPVAGEPQVSVSDFRIVTYNIHGGTGPNGEGSFSGNLNSFRTMLNGESIVCMQEVEPDDWNSLKAIFSDYPHRYYLVQCSTKFGTNKRGGNAIFSMFPIDEFGEELVQTDPGGDKWQRKAQYIKIHVGNNHQFLHLFHYHNTYNWHNNGSEAELAGFTNFLQFVDSKNISNDEMTVLIGDFNINANQCRSLIGNNRFINSSSNWVDHIFSNAFMLQSGRYPTVSNSISDHDAVWAVICNSDC